MTKAAEKHKLGKRKTRRGMYNDHPGRKQKWTRDGSLRGSHKGRE